MINKPRLLQLAAAATLVLDGIPGRLIGRNGFKDSPVVGNKGLAQVVANRINSVAKNAEEYKWMLGAVMKMIKETKGKEVEDLKLLTPKKYITDEKGNVLFTPGL